MLMTVSMSRIFQPTLSVFIGVAVAVYGLVHAATRLADGDLVLGG
ncbi:MAG: hypothetical protein ACOC3G_08135 [Phycisphaeraceae bacterium]